MIDFLRGLVGQPIANTFYFRGRRAYTTRPPFVEFVDVDGKRYSLNEYRPGEIDEDGTLGAEEDNTKIAKKDQFPFPNRYIDVP